MSEPAVVVDRHRAPEDERLEPAAALRFLLESEGWALFVQHVRQTYGQAAQNRLIRKTLEEKPVADHSALVQGILGTGEQIAALMQWPEDEIGRLEAEKAEKATHAPGVDHFERHRRVSV